MLLPLVPRIDKKVRVVESDEFWREKWAILCCRSKGAGTMNQVLSDHAGSMYMYLPGHYVNVRLDDE